MPKSVADQTAREKALADRSTIVRAASPAALVRLALTAEEGFLLSRLDRPMSVADLVRSSGLPETKALQLLLGLFDKGGVLIPRDVEKASIYGTFVFSPGELSEDVDLDLERRKQILYLFHRLDALSYWRVLGVTPDATTADVRRAYLEQTKLFHPDAYFRRKLGTYKTKIETIFQRLKLAHDTLLDDELRRKYEREKARTFTPEEQTTLSRREIAALEEEQRQKSRRERLLRAKGFGRLTRAREELALGDRALGSGEPATATTHYQLALELDPRLDEARQKLVEVRRVANVRRADLALEEAERAAEEGQLRRAVDLLRGAAELDTQNPRVAGALARYLVDCDPEFAKDARVHAQRAIDLGDRSADAYLLHGEILLALGLKKNAKRELEVALDKGAERARVLLKKC